MVSMPVTARDKFSEAIYFFNRMLESRTNVHLFPFQFSAFLSALRTVTFYLQKQFSSTAGFREWYEAKRKEMKDDSLLHMLKEMRDEALHERPIELQFWHGPTIPDEGIKTTHLEIIMDTDEQGEIRTVMKVGEDGEEMKVAPLVRWVVDLGEEKEIDILEACESGLRKIEAILREWDQRHGTDS